MRNGWGWCRTNLFFIIFYFFFILSPKSCTHLNGRPLVVPTIGLVQRCRGRPPGRPGRIGCRGSFCLSSFAFGILEYGYRHIPKPVQIHRPPLRFLSEIGARRNDGHCPSATNFPPRREQAPALRILSEVGAGCRDGHCPSGRSRTPAPTDPIRG